MSTRRPADQYYSDVHAAAHSHLNAEPEAQLTTPVSNLFCMVAAGAGLGDLTLVRETRTGRTRPDFGVLHRKGTRQFQRGYIELKAPSVSVDTSTWKDRNITQWRQMAVEAEVLIVCNGKHARLYVDGAADGLDAELPYTSPDGWDPRPLENLLRRFLDARVSPVKSISELATRLAHRTADLRDRLLWLLEQESEAGELARAQHGSWRAAIHAESSACDFADGISQVVSYGMVLAVLSTVKADADNDGIVTVQEARAAIAGISPVMSAAFGPLMVEPLFSSVQVELGHLEALISAIDPARIGAGSDRRGEPWLYFYEDFLSVYDPAERKQAGVYYTPTAVVKAMVAMVDHILVERFGLRAGFADASVVTLDPAVGTGTFPLAVLDRAAARMEALRGPAGRAQVAANLAQNLYGFELLPGPYAVAHLRLTQRLRELDPDARHAAKVLLTDTLESPEGAQEGQLSLFGEARVLAMEQNRARKVKAQQKVTVVIGNPPYRRVKRTVEGRGSGGWVVAGTTPAPAVPGTKKQGHSGAIFDDVLDVARKAGLGVHLKNVYNLYAYFWRWAQWKVFEHHGDQPGVVAFITGSSWLTGTAFVGLREIARRSCDQIYVLDLGGDNRGANPEENVFAIETPVAVVILVRSSKPDPKVPARTLYRRVPGTAEEKLAAMTAIAETGEPLGGDWVEAGAGWTASFVPRDGNTVWCEAPALNDLFPWTQPGCKAGRTWVVGPHAASLNTRWRSLCELRDNARIVAFVETPTGQKGHSKPPPLAGGNAPAPAIVALSTDATAPPAAPYAFRSFDTQRILADSRLLDRAAPALWQSHSQSQIYLTTLMTGQMSAGPTTVVAACVPDLHYFCGRGGKDVLPLYRDAEAAYPNVTRGLLTVIGRLHGTAEPSPEDLAAYVYALLSTPAYQVRFMDALKTPGPRVPLTRDASLWAEAVALGGRMLWLHTYGERFQGPGRGRFVPAVPGVGWVRPVRTMPDSMSQVHYDPAAQELCVGDGAVSGVRPEVWEFSVSGMPVVKKWLSYRTAKGAGRAASSDNPLDHIRPSSWVDEWNDGLLDLIRVLTITCGEQPTQADVLERICAGPLISVSELPTPTELERQPPTRR